METPEVDTPRWWLAELAWRVITLLWIVGVTAAVVLGRFELSGGLRFTALLGSGLATAAAAFAVVNVQRRRHSGRQVAVILDLLLAVAGGFIALNAMDMFTALDTVGAQFNGRVGWLGIVFLGWLAMGLGKESPRHQQLALIGKWTMIAGIAVLLISMGLLPGLVEFGRRLIQPSVLPYVFGTLLAIVSVRALWSETATAVFRTSKRQAEAMEGIMFAAPNILGFLVFFAGPLIFSLFISFTEWDGLTPAVFVGFQNYVDLLSDRLFLKSLRNIILFGLVAVPGAVIPALLLAALLNSKLAGMRFFRAVYFLPSIAGVVGVTLIWKQLFNSTVGFLNYLILLTTDFVNGLVGASMVAPQPQWISDSSIALISVIILFIWQQIGFNTVLFLAGMQGIDGALYEAADIDGAGPMRKLISITVPTLRPTTVFVVATTTILALQLFNEPFILQSPSPAAGPGNATLTPVVYLYQNAFQEFQVGYASAVAWALFILIFGVTLIRFVRSGEEGMLSS